jgi:type VI secretion system protein ImpH
MATPGGGTDPPVEQTLSEEPYRFDFFQAVRLLQRLRARGVPVGREGPPSREAARFLAKQSLGFPASAIDRIDRPGGPDAPAAVTVSFFGLTGPSGVLPYTYTELLLERRRVGDHTLASFLDLLNHRLISLFYRAWEKHHPLVPFERGDADRFAQHLFALIGLGARPFRGRHEFPDGAALSYASFFARRHRPAVVLEGLLQDYFGLAVRVLQFSGRWLNLEPGDRSTIGAAGAHNALGVSFVLGTRVWDEQGAFRLRIGPLSFEEFQRFLPDGPAFRTLAQMTRLFVDAEFDFDVQLVLKAEDVPACRLSSQPGGGARLGRFAWLTSRTPDRDAEEAVFRAGV